MDHDDDVFGDIAPPIALPSHLSHLEAGGSRGPSSTSAHGAGGTNVGSEAAEGFHGASGFRDDDPMEEMEWEEEERQDTLLPELIRHWTNERLAPDILEQRGELIQSVLERVEEQAKLVRELRADPEASEDEHFQIILVQTEVERVRFIVRSYMRTRLEKIEKYAHHILEYPEVQMRLTTIELTHAQKYAALMRAQYYASVLNAMPPHMRHEKADDNIPGFENQPEITKMPRMALKPDKNIPLFVHALQDCGRVLLPGGDSFEIKKGSIHLVRYVTIEENLRRGELELV